MNNCDNCRISPMCEVQGHFLCLDCYTKLQHVTTAARQARNESNAQIMALLNYASESMAWQIGTRSTPPRLQIPQYVQTHINEGSTLNINIDRSVIGMLNTGQIRGVENISINISNLASSGNVDIAQALKAVTEAVAASSEISETQRTELLDQLDELSGQAALPVDKRAKPGVIKAVLTGLASSLSAGGGLAEIWSTWGMYIRSFFGI